MQARALLLSLALFAVPALAQDRAACEKLFKPDVGQSGKDVIWVPTPDELVTRMLQMAKVTPQDYVVDLGAGDGKIAIAAAKQFKARSRGIEYNPEMVKLAQCYAKAEGVADRANIVQGDIFEEDFRKATVVTMYLLPDLNLRLRPTILAMAPGTRVVSHDWDMGEWQPDKSVTLDVPDKEVGHEKLSRVFLWIVPARVAGDWCGIGKAKGATLRLAQEFQRFRGELSKGKDTFGFRGKISGPTVAARGHLNLHLEGDRLRAQALNRKYSPFHRALFVRQRGGRCP